MNASEINVLVGCEESQAVTIEFDNLGFKAHSCDLQDCSGGRPLIHIKDDIFHVLHRMPYVFGLHLFIGHPVCKYLANSGVRWLASRKPKPGFEWSDKYQIYINADRWEKMVDAAIFFRSLLHTNADYVAIENPIIHKYALEIIGEKPTQIIQPWQYGHGETKATCLWLRSLPKLIPTDIVAGREQRIWKIGPDKPGQEGARAKARSKTFPGIAKAMASQWGNYLLEQYSKQKSAC